MLVIGLVLLSGCGAEEKDDKEHEELMKEVEQSTNETEELLERHEKIQDAKKELDELENQFYEYLEE